MKFKSDDEESLGEAADLLVQFVSTNVTPTEMLGAVLLDSLVLLNRDVCVLTADETTEVLRVVEDVANSFRKRDYFHNILPSLKTPESRPSSAEDDLNWIDEQLQVLRFACARNLARAVLSGNE